MKTRLAHSQLKAPLFSVAVGAFYHSDGEEVGVDKDVDDRGGDFNQEGAH